MIRLRLPLPPSINSYHRSVVLKGGVGKVLISKTGRAWRKKAAQLAAMQYHGAPLEGDVEVRITAHFRNRRRDVDNVAKVLLDLLEGLTYGNDRQIRRLLLEKQFDAANPRVEVEVAPYRGPA